MRPEAPAIAIFMSVEAKSCKRKTVCKTHKRRNPSAARSKMVCRSLGAQGDVVAGGGTLVSVPP
ncbi:hypothetical protein, partial [Escherichia coli]|uniref:hypothetical protein n=1 Tax=Escherichia coli TaxID=562 RepID=UPI001BDD0872